MRVNWYHAFVELLVLIVFVVGSIGLYELHIKHPWIAAAMAGVVGWMFFMPLVYLFASIEGEK